MFPDTQFVQRDNTLPMLRLLAERYHAQIRNYILNESPYTIPKVHLEVDMAFDSLQQLCDDIQKAITTPLYLQYSTTTIPLPPNVTLTPISEVVDDGRPCIKCTAEQKEKFIQMIERYCDTCFLGDCETEDADDCRKCLERRVRWEIE